MIFLDFDGVFIDSAFEAFRVMLTATNHIESVFDKSKDHLYKEFLEFRGFIGPAWNYKIVHDAMFYKTQFIIPDKLSTSILQFEEDFFSTRNFYKENDYNNWILLHKKYDFSRYFINCNLDKDKTCFLTNKDKTSVTNLIETLIPELTGIDVLSMNEFEKNKSKGEILRLLSSKPFLFVDDNVKICENVQSLNKNSKIFCAEWGYAAKDQLSSTKIPVLSQRDMIRAINENYSNYTS